MIGFLFDDAIGGEIFLWVKRGKLDTGGGGADEVVDGGGFAETGKDTEGGNETTGDLGLADDKDETGGKISFSVDE